MHVVGTTQLWSYSDSSPKLQELDNTSIRKCKGHRVKSFIELAHRVSSLQFKNPDHVLLFRGQGVDHKNLANNSSLKPTLFRPREPDGRPPPDWELERRFARLSRAEELLAEEFSARDLQGAQQLRRQRILRWAILQHYEVCRTPLIDVTHSLRIAASFASEALSKQAFVYVIAVPNLSGAVTASAEAGLQIVRLSSICPPEARRPHLQEGYLLGEYPDMPDYRQKQHYASSEIDFGRRLIAKFRFSPVSFWSDDAFPVINHDALYPDAHDKLLLVAHQIKVALGPEN